MSQQAFFEQVMKPRYEMMLRHGNGNGKVQDYNPSFDYGGNAQFNPQQYGQMYEQFAKEVMSGIAKESGGNEEKFLQKWRLEFQASTCNLVNYHKILA